MRIRSFVLVGLLLCAALVIFSSHVNASVAVYECDFNGTFEGWTGGNNGGGSETYSATGYDSHGGSIDLTTPAYKTVWIDKTFDLTGIDTVQFNQYGPNNGANTYTAAVLYWPNNSYYQVINYTTGSWITCGISVPTACQVPNMKIRIQVGTSSSVDVKIDNIILRQPSAPASYYFNGTVTDVTSGLYVSGAIVSIYSGASLVSSQTVGSNGVYSISCSAGTFWASYTANGFVSQYVNFTQPGNFSIFSGGNYYFKNNVALSSMYFMQNLYARDNANKSMLSGVYYYITDSDLGYTFSVLANSGAASINFTQNHNYSVTAVVSGYVNRTVNWKDTGAGSQYFDMSTVAASYFTVYGYISDLSGGGLMSPVQMYYPNGTYCGGTTSYANGYYGINSGYSIPFGTYTIWANDTGYMNQSLSVVYPDDFYSRGEYLAVSNGYILYNNNMWLVPQGQTPVNSSWIKYYCHDMNSLLTPISALFTIHSYPGNVFVGQYSSSQTGYLNVLLPYGGYMLDVSAMGYTTTTFYLKVPNALQQVDVPLQAIIYATPSPTPTPNPTKGYIWRDGYAYDTISHNILSGVQITIVYPDGHNIKLSTNLSGYYNFTDTSPETGTYQFNAVLDGYTFTPQTFQFNGATINYALDIYLNPNTNPTILPGQFEIRGGVYDDVNSTACMATMILEQGANYYGVYTTNMNGHYDIGIPATLPAGAYRLRFYNNSIGKFAYLDFNYPDDFNNMLLVADIHFTVMHEYALRITVNGNMGDNTGFYIYITRPDGVNEDFVYFPQYSNFGLGAQPLTGVYVVNCSKPGYTSNMLTATYPAGFILNVTSNQYEARLIFNMTYNGMPGIVTAIPGNSSDYVPLTGADKQAAIDDSTNTVITNLPIYATLFLFCVFVGGIGMLIKKW